MTHFIVRIAILAAALLVAGGVAGAQEEPPLECEQPSDEHAWAFNMIMFSVEAAAETLAEHVGELVSESAGEAVGEYAANSSMARFIRDVGDRVRSYAREAWSGPDADKLACVLEFIDRRMWSMTYSLKSLLENGE